MEVSKVTRTCSLPSASNARYRHPLLQLMPYGPDAPDSLLKLQDAVMGALAENSSDEDRTECIQNLMFHAKLIYGQDDRSSLEIEVLERVVADYPSLTAFELLSNAQLSQCDVRISKWPHLQLSTDSAGKPANQQLSGHYRMIPPNVKDTWSNAISLMLAMDESAISALLHDDALAGIRILRAHTLFGNVTSTSPAAERRVAFFRVYAMGLWNLLLQRARTSEAPRVSRRPVGLSQTVAA